MCEKCDAPASNGHPVLSESHLNEFISEMYDYGLKPHEVEEELRNVQSKRRENPNAHDFTNQYVWNTSDRLDRALGLAQRRMTMVRDYEKRITEIGHMLEAVRLQLGTFGDIEAAKSIISATKAFLKESPVPWAEPELMTSLVLCSICRCEPCLSRISGKGKDCCDHKDDTGSWGLPF